MKKYEDFVNGLKQEVPVPGAVWSQYMDTLEHIEHISKERKRGRAWGKQKSAGNAWMKAAAVAGILAAGTAVFGFADPVAASQLPIIGQIFERVAGNVTYSGDYTEKTVLQEDAQTPEAKEQTGGKDESVYSASDNGITVTASEVYSDGYSIYLAVEVEAEEGSFSNIPSYYTRRFEEKASQMLQTDGVWKTGEKGEAIRLFDSGFEGQAVDDHTFIGMMKLDRDGYSLKEDVLSLELSEIRYSDESISDAEEIEPEHRIAGTWNLAVPFSVNNEQCREISVNRNGSDGFCIQKVFVSPYQVIVFTDTPYTTLSPDTYTREDFEKQWGEKNKEIAAGGDQAVTYEEMLVKKHYEPYELAVYNEKGEALEARYSDPVKTVFAVQEHELSKLHIYVADDADEFGLIKAANEQEARELSVLNAEVEL